MNELHHTAMVVTDIDRSIDFYRRFFDAELETRLRASGADFAQLHELPRGDAEIAFIKIGEGRVELFQFYQPVTDRTKVQSCDIGAFHLAVEVDDTQARYEELVQAGVEFSRPPFEAEGDASGYVVAFCVDPDGNRLELVQTPAE